MFVKLGTTLFCCLILLAAGCKSKSGDGQIAAQANAPQTASAPPSGPTSSPLVGAGFVDACALIDKSEIASVQGAQVQSTVPSTQLNGALAISQCYFTVSSADGSQNLSVHLEVIQADPSSPNAVKDYWERSFGEKGEKGDKEEEEKESGPPLPVPGLGEEAFWTGNNKAGAVYTLKKGKMVRVSIGGPGDQKIKIEKSKRLAENVLKHLS